ncbi:MAG: hypoxanthine phosphoribosyltransferase [Acutalibacteraceae bacterium]
MKTSIAQVLIDEKQIDSITRNIAAQISKDYNGKDLAVVVLLKGSFIFAADIFRRLTVPCAVDFMVVSSYGNQTVSTGKLNITKDICLDIADKDVLVIDDIMDSGLTMSRICAYLQKRNPSSIKTCVLLDKPDRRTTDIQPDYVGAVIPDRFVVGYGLDFDEHYRNLPYIAVLSVSPNTQNNYD